MKFNSSFLIRVTQLTLTEWICLCPSFSIKAFGSTRAESIDIIRNKLEDYTSIYGVHYVDRIGKSSSGVSCPEGFLDLPIDVWKCKLDKQICKLRAWIPLDSEEQFKVGCHAEQQKKENIYRIIQEGIYKGGHHKPGRFLCPTCQGKHRYYYPWELTLLEQFIDTSKRDLNITLVKNNISMSVIFSRLCPKCFKQVISTINPDLAKELEIIQIVFDNDPVHSNLEYFGKKSNLDFVSSYLELVNDSHESHSQSWLLGLALADLFDNEEFDPDYGDALTLAGDWLGLTDEEVDEICNDEDDSKLSILQETANSVVRRVGWAVLCGGLERLQKPN